MTAELNPADLRVSQLFQDLSDSDLGKVMQFSSVKEYPAQTLVIRQDDVCDYFYTLLEGRVRVFRSTPGRDPVVIAELGKGSFFGEMAVLDGSKRSVSVETIEPTKLLLISREDLLKEIKEVPEIAVKLLKGMSLRVRRTDMKLIDELKARNLMLEKTVAELQKLDEMKSKFFALSSHELRTPLGIILMSLPVLHESIKSGSVKDLDFVLKSFDDQIKRLSDKVVSILESSESSEPLREEEMKPENINRIVQEAVTDLSYFFKMRKLKLNLKLAPRARKMKLYRSKIYQIAVNLLTNAIRFTPDGGSVSVGTVWSDKAVELSVSDTGIGIAARHRKDIFKPFFTVADHLKHSSGTYQFMSGGLGLGLTIVKKFVELHNGKVTVVSGKKRGTAVTVTIPLKQ